MKAVDKVARIYFLHRTEALSRREAAEAMGYSGTSGRSMAIIGTLFQFGLIEKASEIEIRVSSLAETILRSASRKEQDEAQIRAALTPQLFRDIYAEYDGGAPEWEEILLFLERKDFSSVAARTATSAFFETHRVVERLRLQSRVVSNFDKRNREQNQPHAAESVEVATPANLSREAHDDDPAATKKVAVVELRKRRDGKVSVNLAGKIDGDVLQALQAFIDTQQRKRRAARRPRRTLSKPLLLRQTNWRRRDS